MEDHEADGTGCPGLKCTKEPLRQQRIEVGPSASAQVHQDKEHVQKDGGIRSELEGPPHKQVGAHAEGLLRYTRVQEEDAERAQDVSQECTEPQARLPGQVPLGRRSTLRALGSRWPGGRCSKEMPTPQGHEDAYGAEAQVPTARRPAPEGQHGHQEGGGTRC